MFNTLFGKLFASYLIVILITVLIIGLLFSNVLASYIINAKAKNLETKALEVSQITETYFSDNINPKIYSRFLKAVSRSINCSVVLVDKNGVIIAASLDGINHIIKDIGKNPMDIMRDMQVPKEYMDEINHKQTVISIEKMRDLSRSMISIGVPVQVGGVVFGGVFLYSPIEDITSVLTNMYIVLIIVVILALFLASMISVYLSRLIIRPLKEMSRIAIAMAKGNYRVKVNFESDDEIGRLAKSLNYLATESERLEKMRRDFVANVSHELRTPLTAIRGFMEPLMDGTVTDKTDIERYHRIIYDETLRMQRLINDLLDLSRLQSGKMAINIHPVVLSEIVKNVIMKMKPQADSKGIQLIDNCPKNIPMVMADEDKIQQVLIIFIDNAIKYTGANGTVVVTAEEGKDFVTVKVSDTGSGIPPEDLEYIWDRFYKADKARGKDGAGLGLAIAKEIIQLHGGTVGAKSQVGRGSTFQFTIKKAKK